MAKSRKHKRVAKRRPPTKRRRRRPRACRAQRGGTTPKSGSKKGSASSQGSSESTGYRNQDPGASGKQKLSADKKGSPGKTKKRNPPGGPSKSRQQMMRQSIDRTTQKKRVTDLPEKYLKDGFKDREELAGMVADYLSPKSLQKLEKVNKQYRTAANDKITALVAAGTHIYHNGRNNNEDKIFEHDQLSRREGVPNEEIERSFRLYKEHANVTNLIFQTVPPITRIGNYAFVYCQKLPAVVIPDTVREIGRVAFGDCKKLTKVTFPKSLETIGMMAFAKCCELKEVDLSHTNLVVLGDNAFGGCHGLTSIKFPNTLTRIHESAFESCGSLKRIDLSDTKIEVIEKDTFKNCHALTQVDLPKTLKRISDDAFEGCERANWIRYLVIPKDCPYAESILKWHRNSLAIWMV